MEGAKGLSVLSAKVAAGGPLTLWHGALAASTATFVGHYPWFVTRNYMEDLLPKFDDLPRKLLRAACIGFTASAVSDTCSNSIRVIKTTKQTHPDNISYPQALQACFPALLLCLSLLGTSCVDRRVSHCTGSGWVRLARGGRTSSKCNAVADVAGTCRWC